MDGELIRQARLAHPFRPFFMVMEDGKRLHVDKPYYLAISHDAGLLVFASHDGGFSHFGPKHVVGIEYEANNSGGLGGAEPGKGAA